MTRQLVLDTETTGISHKDGHRLIEIGCVEMIDRKLTGEHWRVYINPERPIDPGAMKVHGITNEFVADKSLFTEIVDEMLEVFGDAELIIHNARFDLGFLDAELARAGKVGRYPLKNHHTIVDTLVMARKEYPGQRNSLDALCKRLGVNNKHRQLHGALLDSEILSSVYLLMTGGQGSLFGEEANDGAVNHTVDLNASTPRAVTKTKVVKASTDLIKKHQSYFSD